MKRTLALSVLMLVVLVGASLEYTQTASSNSSKEKSVPVRAVAATTALMPLLTTTFNVDRTDDTAAATACTAAANDCSLRGAIIAANADLSADPVVINLQAATTYSLTIPNATQENAAATGDLDITTNLHTVTIVGGGMSGPNASIIDAAGLNIGSDRDRIFHITTSNVTVTLQDLVIQNGEAADDGTSGVTTNPATETTNGSGGGILNDGGSVTLTNVLVQSCEALGRGAPNTQPQFILDARGGGLASLAGTGNVTITGSKLSGNVAQGGDGPAGVNNNVGSNGKGGSIYFEGGTLNITGSRIDNSNANGGNGGGVPQNGMLNGGFGGLAQGGGVWVGGGTGTINNTTFESTVANGGDSGAGGNGSEPAGGADGGGLYSLGNVTVTNSTFHLAGASGGDAGSAVGSSCLGGHNGGDGGAARGGAVFADGGTMTINTATLANNFAIGGNGGSGGQTDGGCGMHGAGGLAYGGAATNNNAATLNIKHGTISLNNAQAGNSGVNQGPSRPARPVAEGTGGGIRVGPASVTLENTIIAANTALNGAGDTSSAPTPGPNVDGAVTSNGHNLLGTATEATGFTGPGDQTGANPMLVALANNGGPTETMALSLGSPAVDAGVASGATLDQRGMPRTVDDPGVANTGGSDGTDIGAYEAEIPCVLECPGDVSVANDPAECGAIVNYTEPSGAGCGTVTCDHPSGSFFGVGDTTVTCTSSAGPSCSFTVTVTDEEDPSISCPADITVDAPVGTCSAVVNFTVSGSDNCGVPTIVSSPASGSVFPVGTTTVTATATDAAGHTKSCTFNVTVKDVTPPVITLNGQTITLWPPNHQYETLQVSDLVASASDLCDPSVSLSSVVIAKVTSDEPENSLGDGNTLNDMVIATDCKSVQLRSERKGDGDGRVYTITFKVTDSSGNSSTVTAKVTVPKSQNGSPAVDSGVQYTVLGSCP